MNIPDSAKGMAMRLARKKLRMRQYELAELMVSSVSTMCEWETGRRIPRRPTWKMFLILMGQRGITFDEQGIPVDRPALDKLVVA